MRTSLPWPVLLLLALLALPRAVLHDLHVIDERTAVNLLLAVVPPLIWIVVVVAARVTRPFPALLVVGGLYGVLLAAVHQILWSRNLADRPVTDLPEFVLRTFAAVSSLFTGLLVGAVAGLLAWAARRVTSRITGP
ncbi:MAG: hypothetical protein ABW046_04085 [Actinoplanes sp.]